MDSDTLKSIADFLHLSYRDNKLLHGVILLQPIDGTRVTGSEKRRTRLFEKICGANAYARIVIATTMWEKMVNQSEGTQKMQERIADKEFWGTMVGRGAKVEKHLNNSQSARRIVSMVINNPTVVLQMQRELSQHQGSVYNTSAGRQLDADLDQTGDQVKREIDKLRGERNAAAEIQELRAELAKVEEDRQRLRSAKTSWQLLTPAWLATLITGAGVAIASPAACIVQ
ncbi:hypothetical protein G6514_003285 [Epicoccum nigrum]|nr:hypothetical protein G6514_003285 [Epicoccum nigrum]